MSDEVVYELKTPFEYAYKGEMRHAKFITLIAPTFKQIDSVTPIKQAFMRAIVEISADTDVKSVESNSESDQTVTGAQALQVMYNGSGDMVPVMLHAERLFRSGAALIEGETKLTAPLLEKISGLDFERMVGEYIANFIAPFLTSGG